MFYAPCWGGNEPGSNPSQLPHKLSKDVSGAIITLLPPPRPWVAHRWSSCSFWEGSSWLWCSWTTWHHPVAKIQNLYQTFLGDRGCLVTSTSGGSCLQFGFWMSSAPYREGERREEDEEGGEREAEFRPWEHHAAAFTPDDLYACVSTQINGAWFSGASLHSYVWVLTGIVGTSLCWWPSRHRIPIPLSSAVSWFFPSAFKENTCILRMWQEAAGRSVI